MAWTKRDFIKSAFEEIGLASYVYDLEPEQMQGALRRLDTMVATWDNKGIKLGYPLPSSPSESNLDEDSGVPDSANQAIILNLAIQLAPSFGKQVSRETKQFAKDSYNGLLAIAAIPKEMQLPDTMPRGAGNKAWRLKGNQFLDTPTETLTDHDGVDRTLDFE